MPEEKGPTTGSLRRSADRFQNPPLPSTGQGEAHPPTPTEPAVLTCMLGGLPQRPLHSPAVRVVPTTDTALVIRLHGSHFFVTTEGLGVELRSVEGGSPASLLRLLTLAKGGTLEHGNSPEFTL